MGGRPARTWPRAGAPPGPAAPIAAAPAAREVVVALLAWRVALCVVTSCSAAPPGPWRNGPRTADLDLVNHEFVATNPSRARVSL